MGVWLAASRGDGAAQRVPDGGYPGGEPREEPPSSRPSLRPLPGPAVVSASIGLHQRELHGRLPGAGGVHRHAGTLAVDSGAFLADAMGAELRHCCDAVQTQGARTGNLTLCFLGR